MSEQDTVAPDPADRSEQERAEPKAGAVKKQATPRKSARGSEPPAVAPALAAESLASEPIEADLSEASAAVEQSGSYVYPDAKAASSQRQRLSPPDIAAMPWVIRYEKKLHGAEIVFTGVFFFFALYFFYLWFWGSSATPCPDPKWKIAAAPGRWTKIIVHHTATPGGTPEGFDKYHRETNKWENGLGYHFLIGNGHKGTTGKGMPDGEVFIGHRWQEQIDGAHVKNANKNSIGIALVGNFEKHPPTTQQIIALRCLLRFLSKEYAIPHAAIIGHAAAATRHTACPGKNLQLDAILKNL